MTHALKLVDCKCDQHPKSKAVFLGERAYCIGCLEESVLLPRIDDMTSTVPEDQLPSTSEGNK